MVPQSAAGQVGDGRAGWEGEPSTVVDRVEGHAVAVPVLANRGDQPGHAWTEQGSPPLDIEPDGRRGGAGRA